MKLDLILGIAIGAIGVYAWKEGWFDSVLGMINFGGMSGYTRYR